MMSDDDDIIILDVKEEPREITTNHHHHNQLNQRQSNVTINNNINNNNNHPHYADFSAGLRFKPLNSIPSAPTSLPTPNQPHLTSHLNVLVENEPKVREIEYPISPPISRKNSLSPTGIKESSSPPNNPSTTTNNPSTTTNNPPTTSNNPPTTSNNPPKTSNDPPKSTNNSTTVPAPTIKAEITLKKDVIIHLKRIDELIGMDAMSITLTPGVVHDISESASPKAKQSPLDPKTPKNRTRKPNEKIRTAPKAISNEAQGKKAISTTVTSVPPAVQREISHATTSMHNNNEINAIKSDANGSNEQRKPLSNITTTSSELNNRSEPANTLSSLNKTPVITTEAPRKALLIDSRYQVIDIPTSSRPSILSTPSTSTTTTTTTTATKTTSPSNLASNSLTKPVTKSVKFADSVKETPQPSTKATTNTAKTIPVHISRSPTSTTSDMTQTPVPKSSNVNHSQIAKPPKPPISNSSSKVSMDRSISVPSAPSPTIQPVLNRQLSENTSSKAPKAPLGHFKPVEVSKHGIEQPKERLNKAISKENVIVIHLNANHNSSDLSDPRIGPRFTAMKQQLEELLMCIVGFNKRLIGRKVNSLPNFVEVNMNMDENILHDSLERFFTGVAAKVTTANMSSIIRFTRLVKQQKVLIEHYEAKKKSSEWVNAVVDAVKINVISEIIRLFVNGDGCIMSDCVDRLPKFLNNILMPMSSGGCSKDPRRNRFGNDSVGFDNYVVNARVSNIYEPLAVLRFCEAGEVPEKVSSATKASVAVEVGEAAKTAHLVRMRPHKEQISSTDLRVISEVIAEKAKNVEGVEKHGEILKCFDTILKKWNVKVAPVVDVDESEKKKKKDIEVEKKKCGGSDDEVVVIGAEKENVDKGNEKRKEKEKGGVKAVNSHTLSYEILKSIEKKEKELKGNAMSKKRRSRNSSSSSSSSSSWKSSSSNRSSTSRSRSRSRRRSGSGSRGRERSRSPRVHRKRFRDHSSNSSRTSREGRNIFARHPSENHRRDHERYRQPHKHFYNSSAHGKKRSRTKSRSKSRSRSGSRGRSGSYKKRMHKKI